MTITLQFVLKLHDLCTLTLRAAAAKKANESSYTAIQIHQLHHQLLCCKLLSHDELKTMAPKPS